MPIAATRLRSPRLAAAVVVAALLFAFSWFFRLNDPNGSFGGLTDDHFFYLVRGWQILFGDLPVRDFVDQGAPLFYYTAAAVQWIGGRGTFSEVVFCVTLIAAGASLTFWLCMDAAGSILIGLGAALFEVFLEPRFYNYPKILVYAVGIPLLWRFMDSPTARRRFWVALVTAVGALYRHDHGVYMGCAMAIALVLMRDVPWRARVRHALLYGVIVIALLLPYGLFIQFNGGFGTYIRQASAWAERDRARAPVVWPGLLDEPAPSSGGVPVVSSAIASVRANGTAWLFYSELALPLVALALLLVSSDAFRPRWPHAREKIALVAGLGLVLDAGFLRAPLDARLADPSVPHAILLAWLAGAIVQVVRHRRSRPVTGTRAATAILLALGTAIMAVAAVVLSNGVWDRLDNANLLEGPWTAGRRAAHVADVLRHVWPLENWTSPDQPGVMRLAFYLRDCTRPSDRVLIEGYMPQVLGLAQRAFAGGNADLRPGFFGTTEAQELTVSRLKRQSVPVVVLDTGASLADFRRSFPIVIRYLDAEYRSAGERELGPRVAVHLLVQKNRTPTGEYQPLDWPCFK